MPWEWETTCFPQSLVGAGAVARLAWVGHSTAGDGVARHSRAQNSTAGHSTVVLPAHAQLESWRGCISEPASPPPGRPRGFPPEAAPGSQGLPEPLSLSQEGLKGLAPQCWLPLLCELPHHRASKTWKLSLLPPKNHMSGKLHGFLLFCSFQQLISFFQGEGREGKN